MRFAALCGLLCVLLCGLLCALFVLLLRIAFLSSLLPCNRAETERANLRERGQQGEHVTYQIRLKFKSLIGLGI